VNGDGAFDFAVGGKSGLFLFLQQKGRPRAVSARRR